MKREELTCGNEDGNGKGFDDTRNQKESVIPNIFILFFVRISRKVSTTTKSTIK